jgi:heme-degrading monooxygenase HmoA
MTTMTNTTRTDAWVILYCKSSGEGEAAITAAYEELYAEMREMPGLLGNELLRDTAEPQRFAVLSSWRNLDDFRAWQTSSAHVDKTSPLRRFQDRDRQPHYAVYQVVAAH